MERAVEILKSFMSEGGEWAEGKMPYLRAPVWLFFLYVFIRHVSSSHYSSLFSGITLGIHELGHVILTPFGTFMMIMGGTIFQIAAPVASFFVFLRQNDYFAVSVSFGWLSTSLFEAARYSGDAERMLLPLVSPFGGEDIIHDWNYMLSKLGMLGLAPAVSGFFWLLAVASMLLALFWGGYLLLIMFRAIRTS